MRHGRTHCHLSMSTTTKTTPTTKATMGCLRIVVDDDDDDDGGPQPTCAQITADTVWKEISKRSLGKYSEKELHKLNDSRLPLNKAMAVIFRTCIFATVQGRVSSPRAHSQPVAALHHTVHRHRATATRHLAHTKHSAVLHHLAHIQPMTALPQLAHTKHTAGLRHLAHSQHVAALHHLAHTKHAAGLRAHSQQVAALRLLPHNQQKGSWSVNCETSMIRRFRRITLGE